MALRASDFVVVGVRLAAFSSNPTDFNSSAVLAALIGSFGKRYDGNLQVLPFPAEAPGEIPRIQLASKDGHWMFTAAPSLINSAWARKDRDESAPPLAGLVDDCARPILKDAELNDMRICRLGLVINRISYAENPTTLLIDRFCNADVKDPASPNAPLRNSTNFEIHNHKRYPLPAMNLDVNSWVRCRTVMADAGPGVAVEQDINTLAEEADTRRFGNTEITAFFSMAANEADAILGKYFP